MRVVVDKEWVHITFPMGTKFTKMEVTLAYRWEEGLRLARIDIAEIHGNEREVVSLFPETLNKMVELVDKAEEIKSYIEKLLQIAPKTED